MTTENEDQYIGKEVGQVPKIDPDEECNGRKVERAEDGRTVFAGYCSLPAGWGVVEGGKEGRRCKLHGGVPSGGAPKNNQNASKHSLSADPHHYYQSLSSEEKQFIEGVAATIQDRLRDQRGEIDHIDRVLSRQVAIELHIVSKASDYVESESGLFQRVTKKGASRKEAAPLLKEIRRYDDSIFKNLKKLGILDDPQSPRAPASEAWRNFIED